MDTLKAFHLIFMVTWFAGLFYLPRLFVYHCEVRDEENYQRFCLMEKRLFGLMSIGMAGTLICGLWLWLGYWGMPGPAWLHAKFGLALLLVGYHHWLILPLRAFRQQRNTRSARFYRLINEVPAAFLVALVLLAVIKPGA